MAERIYPPAKHGAANGAAAAAPPFPARKPQQPYGSSRPIYRAPPRKRRRRCSLCCWFCWLTLLLIGLIFLAAIAGGIFYVLYRPHRPVFSLSSVALPVFNVTAANSFNSKLNVSLTARNPNKKLVFIYDSISISASAGDVEIAAGILPPFIHDAGNTTLLKAAGVAASPGKVLEASAASDLKRKSSLAVEIKLETKAAVMLGNMKTRRVRIRVSCGAVNVPVPKGKLPPSISSPDAPCKVELRIKIWNWYL